MKRVLVVLVILLGFGELVEAKTWNVPSEIATIKTAVEDSAQYGDTVLVAPGTYDTTSDEIFPINMKNGVVLISEKGADLTIIDADSTGRVITCIDVDSTTLISGFTIQNGCAGLDTLRDTTFLDSCGGGILCGANSDIYIKDDILTHNFAFLGAAIYCDTYSFPKIINNLIKEHTIEWNGSGVIYSQSSLVVEGNTITENKGHYPRHHSAIYCLQDWGDTAVVHIMENIISNNECMGVTCHSISQAIVTQNLITNNWCGIHYYFSNGMITKNVVMRNKGYFQGGGIRIWLSSPIVERNIIIGNTVRESVEWGGGIHCRYGGSATIRRNVIAYNTANRGGAIFLELFDGPTIENNTIVGNVSTDTSYSTYGGVVRIRTDARPEIIANGFFDNFIAIGNFGAFVEAHQNNIYYNTYQPTDPEAINAASHTCLDVRNNFWWVTDPASISSLLWGDNITFTPFLQQPNSNAPGEPSQVYSVCVMKNSSYSIPLDTAKIGDTLYIELEGLDWNSLFIDAAMVIISSLKDTYGIGVGLIETDTASGVYQGFAVVDTASNDVWNKIGTNPQDRIMVCANIDSTKCYTVIAGETGIEETTSEGQGLGSKIRVYPNPFRGTAVIKYSMSSTTSCLKIYDLTGRLVEKTKSNLIGNNIKPGIYFIKAEGCRPVKVVKLR